MSKVLLTNIVLFYRLVTSNIIWLILTTKSVFIDVLARVDIYFYVVS